jgi:Spy/CpxP family protein refolding chaperone
VSWRAAHEIEKKESKIMNRIRLVAVGSMLMLAMGLVAQQSTGKPDGPDSGAAGVEQHLKMLSEKLDLSSEQQAKARPILQEMHDAHQKIAQDTSLSPEQRREKMRPSFSKADKKMREILTDEQKKKLDQMEQDAHMDVHGHANPAPPSK